MNKKKMSNKAFAGIWGTVLAVLLIAVLVGNYFASKYATIITRSLGHSTSKIITTGETGNSDYYTSDYSSHDELVAHQAEVSRQMEAEGIVLLENEDTLPLAEGSKVTLFGTCTTQFQYGGGGSGAIDTSKVMSLKEAFEAEGFSVNSAVWDMYSKAETKVGKDDISPKDYSKD
ncbi:MAG: hypothetical protein J6D53_03775, partial [Blautia sp.]|nr:hypothetical protein [Blautia sp.]